jgi:hypothetical protein
VPDPKPRQRRRWKLGSIWRDQFATWLADGDRRDTAQGVNAVSHAVPYLAKAYGFDAARVIDWVREHCPLAASGPDFGQLVACACESRSARYSAFKFGCAIGITPEDRKRLRITMFRSETKAEIVKARAAAAVTYKRALRAIAAEREERTYMPREASVAAQAGRAGVPLRTFWRRLKAARETASDNPVGTVSDTSVGTVSDAACVNTQPYPHAQRPSQKLRSRSRHLPHTDLLAHAAMTAHQGRASPSPSPAYPSAPAGEQGVVHRRLDGDHCPPQR